MQTLENAEQLVHMPHVETRTIVPYEYFYLIIFLLTAAYLDLGPRPLSRELNGVGKQIHKNYPQHGAISVTHRKGANLPGNVPSARVLRELRDDLGDKLLQVHGDFIDLGTPDPGKAQQIIDQSSHRLSGFQDVFQVAISFFVQCGSRLLLQQLSIADDMAKRRAQVMRYGIGERFQLLVRHLQLERVFCQLFLGFEKTFLDPAPNRAEAGHSQPPNTESEKIRQVSAGNFERAVGLQKELIEAKRGQHDRRRGGRATPVR